MIAMLNGEGMDIAAAAPTPIMFNSFGRQDFFIISTFAYAFEDIKVSPSDVEMVDFAPSDLPEALNNGQIDAQVIWEPHGTTARDLLGDKSIRLPSSDIYKTTFNFLTMKSFARENPEILTKFLKAIDTATGFIKNNKEEAQEITANRLNLQKEDVAAHWDEFTFEISLDQSLLINIESEARWAINNNLTDATEVPNYLDYIYLEALEAANPDAVTIFC